MSNEIINTFQTFYDSKGNTLANGTISFFKNRTTDLETIFSDEDLTVAQANPYTLDANGRITGDVKYEGLRTLLIKTSTGATVRTDDDVSTTDPLTAATQSFDTINLAALENLKVDEIIQTLGYGAKGDGGAGLYKVVTAGTGVLDGGDYINSNPSGSFQLELVREPGLYRLRQWGAVGDSNGTGSGTDDTASFRAVAAALSDYETLDLQSGKFHLTGSIDFKKKFHITVKGYRDNCWVMFNHSEATGFDFYNGSYLDTDPETGQLFKVQRANLIQGINFYAFSSSSSLPATALKVRNCAESSVQQCRFIDCSTNAQLQWDQCWSSSIKNHNYFAVRENSTTNYGAPSNSSAGGEGVSVGTDSHNMEIASSRMRAGSPSFAYVGGDATVIHKNSIESGTTNGLEIANACTALEICNNYFEGGQIWDIVYEAAGTNFGHQIHNNFMHSTNSIWIKNECDTNGMTIANNGCFSNGTGVKLGSAIGFKGIRIVGNNFRDMTLAYDIPTTSFKTAGLSYPLNIMKINDTRMGTTPVKPGVYNSSLLEPIATWTTFTGTGTVGASTVNHSGVNMIEVAETGAGTYIASIDFKFDPTMKGEFVTINMPMITNAGTNVTVVLDDGVLPNTYTLNSNAVGSSAVDGVLYYLLSASATRIRIKLTVATALTVKTLIPSVRMGLHDDLKYKYATPEPLTTTSAALLDITNAVNTTGLKVEGYKMYNITTRLFVIAAGDTDGSAWVFEGTGNVAFQPV